MSETLLPKQQSVDLRTLQRGFLVLGGISAIACAIGAVLNLEAFFQSFLFAWLSWLSIPLGSLMIVMTHQLTGGRWGSTLQPGLTTAMNTLPLFALLFVLIAIGMPDLFIWCDAEYVAADSALQKKAAYLNVPRFLIFAGIYFAVWIGLSWKLSQLREKWLKTKDERAAHQAGQVSGIGLLLVGLTVSFAAIDWIMSLEPHWFSSIFGMLVASSMVLPGFAFGILVLALQVDGEKTKKIPVGIWSDLGNLLLALVMIWAYMAFSQFFLIWSGNLPEEISWYLQRNQGIWVWLALAMVLFYFVFPFLFLLMPEVKSKPRRLAGVATLLVVIHFAYLYWLVKPAFMKHTISENIQFFQGTHWLDPIALLAVGGLWGGLFVNRLRRSGVPQVLQDEVESEDEVGGDEITEKEPANED